MTYTIPPFPKYDEDNEFVGGFDTDRATQIERIGDRIRAIADDAYIMDLARALTRRLGGKVGLAPRLFLKKIVGELLDRIELFPDFDPRRNYELTLSGGEMSLDEKEAATGDDMELSL